MDKQQSVNFIVAALYAAAVDPALWPTALGQVARLAEANSAVWFLHDQATNRLVEANAFGGITRRWLDAYTTHYQPLDLARQVLERLPSGEMRPMHRHLLDEAIARSEYYQDFYIPSGHRYSCGGVQVFDGMRAILSVHRPADHCVYDESTVRRLQQVLNHLPGICRVRALSQAGRATGSLSTAALAVLPRAVLVVDSGLRVHYLNPAAEALLRPGSMLRVAFERLCAGEAALTLALARRVAGACRRPPQVEAVPLYKTDVLGRPVLELQVAPLPEDLPGNPQAEPLALLMVRRCFSQPAWRSEDARPCGLSAAEFRLVGALVEGLTPEEYGVREGISINTVRVHIRNILRKTSTRRVAEVIALFAPLEAVAPLTPPA